MSESDGRKSLRLFLFSKHSERDDSKRGTREWEGELDIDLWHATLTLCVCTQTLFLQNAEMQGSMRESCSKR